MLRSSISQIYAKNALLDLTSMFWFLSLVKPYFCLLKTPFFFGICKHSVPQCSSYVKGSLSVPRQLVREVWLVQAAGVSVAARKEEEEFGSSLYSRKA